MSKNLEESEGILGPRMPGYIPFALMGIVRVWETLEYL